MMCPGCGVPLLGLRCKSCGHEKPAECPDCRTGFGWRDRYCRACGRDLTCINFRSGTGLELPTNLLPEDYEHPKDRAGLKRLRKIGPLRELSKIFLKSVVEPHIHANLLGSAVKVSATQFPRVHRIAKICERVLDLPPVNIFIGKSHPQAYLATALSWGTEHQGCIFIEVDHFDHLTDLELQFVLGREMGHIKSRHLIYLTIARAITAGFGTSQRFGMMAIGAFNFFLTPWLRAAEISVDRVGLICNQDLPSAITAMLKVELSGEDPKRFLAELNLEEFMRQGEVLKEKYGRIPPETSRPFLTDRFEQLLDYVHSPEYARVFQAAADPHRPRAFCSRCHRYQHVPAPAAALDALVCEICDQGLGLDRLLCPDCFQESAVPAGCTLEAFRCEACDATPFAQVAVRALRPPEDHDTLYAVLCAPRSASRRDLEHAYTRRARPLSPRRDDIGQRPLTDGEIRDRIRLDRAFQILSDRRRRELYDLRLDQRSSERDRTGDPALDLDPEADPGCARCDALLLGPACTICGQKPDEDGESASPGPDPGILGCPGTEPGCAVNFSEIFSSGPEPSAEPGRK